jgi:putative ABC transport system permease protein
MIRNYIKTAYRSLLKNKGFTFLNVLGLSVGLATCLLIVFYVVDELNYDQYNTKADRIYRMGVDAKLNGNAGIYATSEKPWKEILQSRFPQVEKVARLINFDGLFLTPSKFYFKKGSSDLLEKKVVFTESSIFDVFTLPMIHGTPTHALDEPGTVVITESTALRYFGKADAVGQTLTLDDTHPLKVTGVIKDIPQQSHFHYDFFVSFSTTAEYKATGWGYAGLHQYLLLKPGTDVKNLENQLTGIDIKNSFNPSTWTTGDNHLRITLTPLLNIHLKDSEAQYPLEKEGNIQYIYIFSLVAIFILLIACVNFMNLSTARSANRAKEVGVRKVLGSPRKYLVAQFLTESVLVTLASAIIAVVMAWALLPAFNQMADKQLTINPQTFAWLIPSLVVIILMVGFLAGSYPALYLSSFQPIQVLKGKIAAGFKGGFLRSFLVVFQFSISIFLIVGTLVIYNQMNYIHNKDLGFNRDQVLVIKNTNVLGNRAKILKDELKQLPDVQNATMSSYQPTGDEDLKTGLFPHQKIDIKEDILTEFWSVDEDFINTMGLKLTNGRNFAKDMASDTAGMIVNEAFVRKFGQLNPLNKNVYRDSYGLQQYHIIGVVKDFNFASLKDNIGPLAMIYQQDNGAISVKLHSADLTGLMSKIQSKWKGLSPGQPFNYSFMDEDFDATYRVEQRFGSMFISFSSLAIIIACLGLFGLAAYAAEQRNKEIGIRKVLGANISTIVGMLSMDFIKLVFISILIASPLAWFAMNKWLEGFAYRVVFHWYLLGIAGAAAILIAFVTISFQSIKAALANPVDSLRSE